MKRIDFGWPTSLFFFFAMSSTATLILTTQEAFVGIQITPQMLLSNYAEFALLSAFFTCILYISAWREKKRELSRGER